MLTAISSHPDLDLRAGATVSADEVFKRLAPVAKATRDDAPM